MNVPEPVGRKVSEELRQRLEAARPEEAVRGIALLRADPTQPDSAQTKEMPSPSEFVSRTAWRETLNRRKEAAVQRALEPVLREIRRLGVTIVAGGRLSKTIVLEGRASSVVNVLSLDGVAHADVDRAVSLEGPERPRTGSTRS
jgi:hypothetical protein